MKRYIDYVPGWRQPRPWCARIEGNGKIIKRFSSYEAAIAWLRVRK